MGNKIQIIALDDKPQVQPKPYGPLTVSGGGPSDLDSMIEGDERIGARAFTYRGGNFIVYPNVYHIGNSMRKRHLGRFAKFLFRCGIGTFAIQVNYGNACMGTNECCRALAIRRSKKWIDEQERLDG
jgi:hypothetical protein